MQHVKWGKCDKTSLFEKVNLKAEIQNDSSNAVTRNLLRLFQAGIDYETMREEKKSLHPEFAKGYILSYWIKYKDIL